MPLFDGFLTKAKVGEAKAQFEKVKGQKMLLESALSVQIDHLHTTLLELKERAAIFQSSIKEARGADSACSRRLCLGDHGLRGTPSCPEGGA